MSDFATSGTEAGSGASSQKTKLNHIFVPKWKFFSQVQTIAHSSVKFLSVVQNVISGCKTFCEKLTS
jgi:hypothetical protein